MFGRIGGTLALGAALALAGCSSSHEIDRPAWQKAEADLGVSVTDWAKWETTALDICKEDDPSLFLAQVLDKKTVPLRAIELNYTYACPDRKNVFDEAVAKNKDASTSASEACSTPASTRTEKQQQLAEALGCA